jgi:hypothetical protein
MQVATTVPQTSKVLLAVSPDKAKILAVVAQLKASLRSVKLYLDNTRNVAFFLVMRQENRGF